MSLVNYLISSGYLKTPIIIEAFEKVKRADFLPDEIKEMADLDQALPIGKGQTISQPAVVAFMLELLQPKPGDKVLDIGSGSGWTTALLAYIVSKEKNSKSEIRNTKLEIQENDSLNRKNSNSRGKVIAIEIIPELKEFGEKNVSKYNFIEKGIVEFVLGDGKKGFKKEAPFDRILVSAAAKEIPEDLKEQLKIGGRLVIPVEDSKNSYFSQSIWMLEKTGKREFKIGKYPGFVFVPLV